MRDLIAKLAAANGRSMNAELIDRLEKSMAESIELKKLLELHDRIDDRLEQMKSIMGKSS